MRKGDGLSIAGMFLLIIALIALAFFAGDKIFGKDGVMDKITEADNQYNKVEIVDSLNLIVKEKYVLDYKYAIENNLNPDEICTTDNFFKYLLETGYIEQLKDINDNLVQDQYYIRAEALKSDLATGVINENGSESNGTKEYKIKKLEDKYMIFFVDKYGDEEELGELIIKSETLKETVK